MSPPKLMGIVNITPDSFSDGGAFFSATAAVEHAVALIDAGADIIDLGAESTRPNATPLTPEEEWARLEPVLSKLVAHPKRPQVTISIDTRHAATAAHALTLGVEIINDVTGLRDPKMRAILSHANCRIVVMHALSVPVNPAETLPEGTDMVAAIARWKQEVELMADVAGIARERLIFDPGLGFGKTAKQSMELIDRVSEIIALGGQWLYGHSKKSFLKLLVDNPEEYVLKREALTIEISSKLDKNNVNILRIHDVESHKKIFTNSANTLQVIHLNNRINDLLISMNHPSLPGIDLSLDRMQQLLAVLGNPQNRLPPVVHVAGTNGKGSTIAYLRAIYEAAGYHVHVYTSPHLVRFNERIVLNGEPIDDARLEVLLQRVAEAGHDIPTTFFEATTAAAFLAFSEYPADVLLLETGLGGRLDATNMVPQPLCSVITPVDLDHTEFLGETIEKIAFEKAGIMRTGTACVSAMQTSAASQTLRTRAKQMGVPLFEAGHEWSFEQTSTGIALRVNQQFFALPAPNLLGVHQFANAALAASVALYNAAVLPITLEAIAKGIAHAQWPARLQLLHHGPLVKQWGGEVVLDGGHNPHAARAIAQWIDTQNQPVVMLCAMMRRKNASAYFEALRGRIARVCCIPMPEDAAGYRAAELASLAREAGLPEVSEATNAQQGIAQLQCGDSATLLIAGSLHLAGEILKNHG